jgi:signal transduction histidine kinase
VPSSATRLINLVGIGLVIGAFSLIPAYIGPALPPAQVLWVRVPGALFVAGWLFLLVRPVPAHGVGRVAWPFSSRFVVWGGIALLTSGFWAWMPYADEGVLLVCMLCQFCTVTLYSLMSIEPPPSRGRIPLAPLVLPVSIALYLVVHPSRFSLPLVVFDLGFMGAIVAMQQAHQRAVDDAHHARQAAEAALRQVAAERDAKTRFLASASHDLGQPLQAAQLSFDQALRATEPAVRERAAARVRWALDASGQMLQRMLEHLRLESGDVSAQVDDVALGPLLAHLCELHEPAARLANLRLHVLPSRLVARADPALLARAIGNLLVNGIRHSKASRILVAARRRGGRVQVWVIDDGVGIPAADAATLFDDYVQGSNHGDEIRGGFGLGLASVRRMAELMDGRAGHAPRWRSGSAFWIDVPLRA